MSPSKLVSGADPFTDFANVSDVVVEHPLAGLPEIMTVYVSYPDYVQVLVEFEDGLLITDAAPHRSKLILEWVAANMKGKNITHVVPSHHHFDHACGFGDYMAAGATLVIPEVAKALYNFTGQVSKMQTYTDDSPFVVADDKVQFRSFWKAENPHAEDWTFGVATRAEPTNSTEFVIFNADVISPGNDGRNWEAVAARDFLISAVNAGVPPVGLLVGAHGSTPGG